MHKASIHIEVTAEHCHYVRQCQKNLLPKLLFIRNLLLHCYITSVDENMRKFRSSSVICYFNIGASENDFAKVVTLYTKLARSYQYDCEAVKTFDNQWWDFTTIKWSISVKSRSKDIFFFLYKTIFPHLRICFLMIESIKNYVSLLVLQKEFLLWTYGECVQFFCDL